MEGQRTGRRLGRQAAAGKRRHAQQERDNRAFWLEKERRKNYRLAQQAEVLERLGKRYARRSEAL